MAKKIRMVDEVEEAEMERDARRYRYIRDNALVSFHGTGVTLERVSRARGSDIDALVDRLQEGGE